MLTAAMVAALLPVTMPSEAEAVSTPTVLMSLTRSTAAAAESGNKFNADSGVFASESSLTAWNNNEQVTIGGTGRTPIVINNNQTTATSGWYPASVGGIQNATAFQINFSTTGYDDIRFSASQKSTGSGPDAFILAYSLNGTDWVKIPDSRTGTNEIAPVIRVSNDTYTALEQTYDNFILPAVVNNQAEVYLRVVFDGLTTLGVNGNTSINDIVITSGVVTPDEPDEPVRADYIIINQAYARAVTTADIAVSHSFIELYNPTDDPIDLDGLSLQYFQGRDRDANPVQGRHDFGTEWEVLPLTGTIEASSSFLIVGGSAYTPAARYTINNFDMTWDTSFSNRAFSFALVDGIIPLDPDRSTGTPGLNGNNAIIDLVGATNTHSNGDRSAFYEKAAFDGISNQVAMLRVNFFDTNDNSKDFETIRYATNGINNARLTEVRPRYSGDGAWEPGAPVPAHRQLMFTETTGFFENPFDLELSTDFFGGVIRYTLDGSEPTKDSPVYDSPIHIINRTSMPDYGGNRFTDCTMIIRGTGTSGDVVHIGQNDPPHLGLHSAEIIGGVFETQLQLSALLLEELGNVNLRITVNSNNSFAITDIIVTKDSDGTVLYTMQEDVFSGTQWNGWSKISDTLHTHGGTFSASGDTGSRIISNTNREQSWMGFEFAGSSLAVVTEGLDLSTKATFVPSHPVSKGTVVRAAVFDENGNELTSVIHTQSYFVGLQNNYPGLPVISLTTDSDNLFDWDNGIYQTGPGYRPNVVCPTCTWVTFCACPNAWGDANFNQRGRDWERPVHFELIETDGSTFAQDAGLRIHGNWSRYNPQKSLRLYAREEYSPGRRNFEYDLFGGDARDVNGEIITTFQRFLLRQNGQDNGNTMMRDAFLQSAADDLNVLRQSYRQAVVFINGEFWGYYNIRERIDEYFFNDNALLGDRRMAGWFQMGGWGFWSGDADDVFDWGIPCDEDCFRLHPDSFCLGRVHWEDQGIRDDYESYMTMWNWFNDVSGNMTDAQYLEAQRYIDVDNVIDYWAYCLIVANDDWPSNNVNIWRYRADSLPASHEVTGYNDGRWRYNFRDMDMAFGIYGGDKQFKNLMYVLAENDYVTTLPLRRLMTNAQFRERFIARACDIMNTNAHASVMIPKINAFADVIDPIVNEQVRRWNSPWHGSRENWRANGVGDMINFANGRQAQFLSQMNTYFKLNGIATITANNPDADKGYIKVNSIDIVTSTEGVTLANRNSWSGQYLRGSMQTVTAVPADGYYFKQFTINGVVHASSTVRFNLAGNTVVSVEFAKVDCNDACVYPDAWTVRIPATTSETGLEFKKCISCGDEITREIPKLTNSPSRPGGGGGGSGTTTLDPVSVIPVLEQPKIEPHVYTTADALTILRHVAGLIKLTDEQVKLYDFNGDGKITTTNALHILRYVAGLIDKI